MLVLGLLPTVTTLLVLINLYYATAFTGQNGAFLADSRLIVSCTPTCALLLRGMVTRSAFAWLTNGGATLVALEQLAAKTMSTQLGGKHSLARFTVVTDDSRCIEASGTQFGRVQSDLTTCFVIVAVFGHRF